MGNIPGISFLKEQEGSVSNRWLTIIILDPKLTGGIGREDIRLALAEENIESRPLWKPMHIQPLFESAPYFGKGIAMKLFKHGLCLPSGSNLTEVELIRVVTKIKSVLNLG